MRAPDAPSPLSLAIPALWVFVVPLIAYFLAAHHLGGLSEAAAENLVQARQAEAVAAGQPLTEEALAALKVAAAELDVGSYAWEQCRPYGFFHEGPDVPDGFCGHVLQFTWARGIAQSLLGAALLLLVVIAGALGWVSLAPSAQHWGYRLGWTALRVFAVPHVVGQGLLLVFLSFWVTALWFDVYLLKLIVLAAVLAAFGVGSAFIALFRSHDDVPTQHGKLLQEAEAPEFFAAVRALAERVGVAPPDQIVVGIDANFFVTESPLEIFARFPDEQDPTPKTHPVHGRTLFASLALLQVLRPPECDAILAHELGHFANGDTQQTHVLNPLLRSFAGYMQAVDDNFTFGVASCMRAFHALFLWTSLRHGREAEFAADAVAARTVGAEQSAHALLKVAAYASYRDQQEATLLERMEQNDDLRIAERVRAGFLDYLQTDGFREELLATVVAHPFDTHPPVADRLERLRLPAPDVTTLATIAVPAETTRCDQIPIADAIATELWQAYEAQFAAQHDFFIALRLDPQTEAEIAHVERHFPPLQIASQGAAGDLVVDYRGIVLASQERIAFAEIRGLTHNERTFGGPVLEIERGDSKTEVPLGQFEDNGAYLMAVVERYLGRHHVAAAQRTTGQTGQTGDPG